MIKKFTTTDQIETILKVIGSKHLNELWFHTQESFDKEHWVSAFNFKLEQFFSGEEVGH
jgi:hypothetical protein